MATDADSLFREYQESKSRKVRNRLVEMHMELVEYYVGRYNRSRMEEDDLRQQALLALIKAVERFDPDLGVTFKTFANRTVDGELKRLLRDKGWSVRPPRSLQELAVHARRLEPEMTQELGRAPRVAELAERIGESTDRVLEALAAGASYRADSLDTPVGDGNTTRGALIPGSDGSMDQIENQLDVDAILADLDERDRLILERRFIERKSQQEIADELGVSQSYLSRLLRQTLERARAHAEEA